MAKRKYSDPSAPLWCLSYGDMVTNMLCFFVMLMMFATFGKIEQVASKSESRAADAAFSVSFTLSSAAAANAKPVKGSKDFLMVPTQRNVVEMPRILKKIKKLLQTVPMKDLIEVTPDEQNIKIIIPSKVLFLSGSATLRPESDQILLALLPILAEVHNDIRVDGHSDDVPTKNPTFPSNWELSSARACSVVRFLIERGGLFPTRFSAQGYAENRPLQERAETPSEADRVKNRRVEINILAIKRKRPQDTSWK